MVDVAKPFRTDTIIAELPKTLTGNFVPHFTLRSDDDS